jgi:deoxyribonuclease-4
MPLFGAHMSIAGGYPRAVRAAEELGMETVQLFTSSPQVWPVPPAGQAADARPIDPAEVRTFRQALRRSGLRLPMAHDSYLINLASPDAAVYRRSIEAFVVEMDRAERLGLRFLVTHPGAALDSSEAAALARVARALDEVHARCPRHRVRVLLETTAGQGSTLGHRFEHLAAILQQVAAPRRLGVCLDTCHVFAAGYALAPRAEYEATLREFDRVVGLRRLRAFHLNDSVKPRGSRVDRHAAIGRGELGLEPFRLLVNDPRFRSHPMVLETPKEGADGTAMDPINLAVLRGLVVGA